MNRSTTHITETASRILFEQTLANFSNSTVAKGDLLFRAISERDYGIDGEVELFSHGEPTGRFAKIQLKSTEKKIKKLKREDAVSCSDISKSNLKYCQQKNLPVILVYCSTTDGIFYFVDLQSVYRIKLPEMVNRKTGTVHIPVFNNSENLNAFVDIINSYYDKNELTHQVFDIPGFVKAYDNNSMNAPIDTPFCFRENELERITNSIENNLITVICGASGTGKTRLSLEACRKYAEEGWTVYCVKSNGRLLYNDIDYYLDQQDKCLLFFDDANTISSLKNVLEQISSLDVGKVRILMTVRDYAASSVTRVIRLYQNLIVRIEGFSKEEIREILKRNYNIINNEYLAKIVQVSKGNIRLAAMAAIRAVESGFPAIANAEDIFRTFYDPIIENAGLKKDEKILLSIIAIAGPVRNNKNRLFQQLCEEHLTRSDYEIMLERLYEIEFIDWFKSEIISISDQSFGNYIVYHVIFEKKWVRLDSLIFSYFPAFRGRIVYTLNTLYELFPSEDMETFLKNSITSAWEKADEEYQKDYLAAFYTVNPLKGLSQLKEYVADEISVDIDLRSFDYQNSTRSIYINTDEIRILAGYNKTQYYEPAADLLLDLFEKRPDLLMDFCDAFTNSFYNQYSERNNFQFEQTVVEKLWARCQSGECYKYTILFLRISSKLLECEANYTEPAEGKSFNIVIMSLPSSDEIKKLRQMVLSSLCSLYLNPVYNSDAASVLRGQHYSSRNETAAMELCCLDYECVNSFFSKKNSIDLEDALIIDNYRKNLEYMGAAEIGENSLLSECYAYQIYNLLTKVRVRGRTIEEEERKQKERLLKAIESYTLRDFGKMFEACKTIEELDNSVEWNLGTGIAMIFDLLKGKTILTDVIEIYMKAGAPVYLHQKGMIKTLLSEHGYEEAFRMIEETANVAKDELVGMLYESIDDECVNREIAHDYTVFQTKQLQMERPIILPLKTIKKYINHEIDILYRISVYLIQNPNRIEMFFGYAVNKNDADTIEKIYRNRHDLLENLYFACDSRNFDYRGNLFEILFRRNPDETWRKLIQKNKDNCYDHDDSEIFGRVWKDHYSYEYIDYAFTELIDNTTLFSEERAKMLFDYKKDDPLKEKKKEWFKEKMEKGYRQILTVDNIISSVAVLYPEYKNEMILHFLSHDNSVDSFKKLALFPLSYTIVGSEIPFIDNKIRSLEELESRIKGVCLIDHKLYLQERIQDLKHQRKEAEIKEYIDNEM